MENELISHEEALSKGLTHFFTGRPCRNQHIARRYVNGGACVECINGDKIVSDALREQRVRTAAQKVENERVKLAMAQERLKLNQQRSVATEENKINRKLTMETKAQLYIKTGVEIDEKDLPAMKDFALALAQLRILESVWWCLSGLIPQISERTLFISSISWFIRKIVKPSRDQATAFMQPHYENAARSARKTTS